MNKYSKFSELGVHLLSDYCSTKKASVDRFTFISTY